MIKTTFRLRLSLKAPRDAKEEVEEIILYETILCHHQSLKLRRDVEEKEMIPFIAQKMVQLVAIIV